MTSPAVDDPGANPQAVRSVTPGKLLTKSVPGVNVCRLPGIATPSQLLSNPLPEANVCKLLEGATASKLWVNILLKVNVCRLPVCVEPCKLQVRR